MNIRLLLALAAAVTLLPASRAQTPPVASRVAEAIVKIYTIQDVPDYYNPWSMRGPRSTTGSGCIVKGNRILTNAHVVGDETFIQVRRYGEARKVQARVLSVSHEADLALLAVDDDTFFDGVTPLDIGQLPQAQQEVLVYGFPLGGDMLSVTKGVVSRIEHQTYAHSSCRFLAGQIDAAINPGNSGGPVMEGNKVVGVVMQSIQQADNIGYMVPVPILRHFLDDIEDGSYDGFPSMGAVLQDLENPDMKRMFKVQDSDTGVLVARVLPGSAAEGYLREGDVLVSVDGTPIADDGTVEFRPKERTSVAYVVQEHQVGDPLEVGILRDGAPISLNFPLNRSMQQDWLVPMELYDRLPTYYVYGGVVFCPLTKNVLQAWGSNWYNTAPKELVAQLSFNFPEKDGQEIVLVLKVLPADINEGYHNLANWVVESVNGEAILNLRDLIRKVEGSDSPFVVLAGAVGHQIVLDRARAEEAAARVLATYRVPSDRSADLRATETEVP